MGRKLQDNVYKKIQDELKAINEDGGYNPSHLWKLKDKIILRYRNPPTAMRDSYGKLIGSVTELKEHETNHMKKVLGNRKIKSGLEGYQKEREDLCMARMSM